MIHTIEVMNGSYMKTKEPIRYFEQQSLLTILRIFRVVVYSITNLLLLYPQAHLKRGERFVPYALQAPNVVIYGMLKRPLLRLPA